MEPEEASYALTMPTEIDGVTAYQVIDSLELELDDDEVLYRGGNVFQGYLNDPEKTADSRLDNGWSTLGDVGRLDDDGFLYLVTDTNEEKDEFQNGPRMNYPRGLIRYTSEHELKGGTTHWLRPRIVGYVVVLCLMVGLFWYHMLSRIPLELTIIRDRNQLYTTTDSGAIENIYTLQLVNMHPDGHEFEISISGIEGATIIGDTRYHVDGGEVRTISLRVRAEPGQVDLPSTELDFQAVATDMPSLQAGSESRFLKPL